MDENNLCQEISFEEEIENDFHKLIGEIRKKWRDPEFNQSKLAKKAGVSAGTLSKFCKKGIIPNTLNLYKLLYAYLGHPPICISPDCNSYQKAISSIKLILSNLPE